MTDDDQEGINFLVIMMLMMLILLLSCRLSCSMIVTVSTSPSQETNK